jgi:glycosyltransferase involved in cell wall biosynthesis
MLSNEEIIEVYNSCSIGLILFNNVGQYFMAYSLKLFEYMRSGLIIVVPDFGDWIPFNSSYNVGINVNTSDSLEIARTIDALDEKSMQDIAKSNILKVGQHFTWESQEKKLYASYNELIKSNN